MDDLLALLEADPVSNDVEANAGRESGPPECEVSRSNDDAQPNRIHASVDAKVDIRMFNRRISGADLLDLVESYPYHTAPSIAAMSTAALNRLLVDPAISFLDRSSTVCGPTNLATVSVVLSNSGTKISANSGNAYCLIELGSLTSGPAISVMLFGAAYSHYCRTCTPGNVVALICPRLAPAKTPSKQSANFSTTVLFSVQDTDQCRIVADSKDFARCKATLGQRPSNIKLNAEYGPMQKQCKNIIDKREGEYCSHHKKLALCKKGTTLANGPQAMSKLLAESKTFPGFNRRLATLPTGSGKTLTLPVNDRTKLGASLLGQRGMPQSFAMQSSSRLTKSMVSNYNQSKPNNAQKALAANGPKLTLATNPILNPGVRTQTGTNPPCSLSKPTPAITTNPYIVGKRTQAAPRSMTKVVVTCNAGEPGALVTSDWLNPQGRRVSLGTDKGKQCDSSMKNDLMTKTISKRPSVDSARRDGNVMVPRPSKVFTTNPFSGQVDTSLLKGSMPMPKERSVDEVLLRQQVVAEQLKRVKANTPAAASVVTVSASRPPPQLSSREALLFNDLTTDDDMDNVVAAKSKYEAEALAEEYTRSRNRIVELDQQENKKSQDSSKSKKGPIEKTWQCITCRQTFKAPPLLCQRRGHVVKVQRSLQSEQKSKDEQRQRLSEAKDGLVLGTGIEWSRWKGNL